MVNLRFDGKYSKCPQRGPKQTQRLLALTKSCPKITGNEEEQASARYGCFPLFEVWQITSAQVQIFFCTAPVWLRDEELKRRRVDAS